MVQRGFYYAASAVMICAIGAASLQLAAQILSLGSALADAVASAAVAAILLSSARRRLGATAKRHPVRATVAHTGGPVDPANAKSAGMDRRESAHHHDGTPQLADAA